MSRGIRVVLLVALFVALAALVIDGVVDVQRELAITEACDAVREFRFEETLKNTAELVGSDEAGLSLVQCRCLAQLETGDAPGCFRALDDAMRATNGGFVPDGLVAQAYGSHLLDRGDDERAREVVLAALAQDTANIDLLLLAARARLRLEEETLVVDDIVRGLDPRVDASLAARLAIANLLHEQELDPLSLAVLGDTAPTTPVEGVRSWFIQRGGALASTGDVARTAEHFERFRAIDADHRLVDAYHGAVITRFNLSDPERPLVPFLSSILEDSASLLEVLDPNTHQFLYLRLCRQIATQGETERAIRCAAEARKFFPEIPLVDDELARARMDGDDRPSSIGTVVITHLDDGETLLVSSDVTLGADAPLVVENVRDGKARIRRSTSKRAVHYVVRAKNGVVRTAGSAWPEPTGEVVVDLSLDKETMGHTVEKLGSLPVVPLPKRAPPDGRRRVVAVLLDGGDWRLVRLGIAMAALPTFDALISAGHLAVVDSNPPFTGAAIRSIVRPSPRGSLGFMRRVVEVGQQIASLRSDRDDPIGLLSLLAPDTTDLFGVLGSGDRRALNLMLSSGNVEAGETRMITGPAGKESMVASKVRRPLRPDELARYPALEPDASTPWALELPATFDAIDEALRDTSIDFVLAHVDATDRAAHFYLSSLERRGVEIIGHPLMELYRYVDERLRAVATAIDDDDVLIVFSDHGMQGGIAHDRASLFFAYGGPVALGRTPGTPALRGLPRLFADLLGVSTTWEDTGIGEGLLVEDRAP